ncbi:MAG: hypothetical protein U0930_22815 [Pirellulales bacterium]
MVLDQQTKMILLSVLAGMVVMGVAVYLWSSIRAIRSASRRKFGARPDRSQDRSSDCTCPPHQPVQCVPARVSVPDNTPVAISGVRTDGSTNNNLALSQSQVQQIVDRANRLQLERQNDELDQLLGELSTRSKS